MRRFSSLLLATAVVSLAALPPAFADWRDHDIHGFHEHDFDHWRGGYWHNGFHDGRSGWWWVVDGAWYFYPAPVYPYPDPYTPPAVAVAPGAVVGQSMYYYCRHPAGYYPYVPSCHGSWEAVPAAGAPTTVIVQQQQPATATMVQPPAVSSAPPPASAVGGAREADEQQLKTFAAEVDNVDTTGKQAKARLTDIEKRLEAFRQSLYKRDYNAMEMLKRSEDLQRHIAEEKARIAGHKVQSGAAPAAVPASAPTSVPPGTSVTFPPGQ